MFYVVNKACFTFSIKYFLHNVTTSQYVRSRGTVDDVTRTHFKQISFSFFSRRDWKAFEAIFAEKKIPEHIVERIIMKGRWKGSFCRKEDLGVMPAGKRARDR